MRANKMDYLGINKAHDILNQYRNNPDSLELELRFGRFIQGFNSDVGLTAFQRIKSFLMERGATHEISRDTISGSIRRTERGSDVIYMKKTRIATYDIANMGVRLSLSKEEEVPLDAFIDTESVVRHKERYSLVMNSVRVDATQVKSGNNITYEVELEFIDSRHPEKIERSMNDTYAVIFSVLYDSPNVFTAKQAGDLYEYLNRSLLDFTDKKTQELFPESEVRNKLSYYPFPRPRNITTNDLKYGGIVGGKITYSVTYKTDGEHKLLVINKDGIWLVNPPNSIALIGTVSNSLLGLIGLILEGEVVPLEKRRTGISSKYLFYVYDCVACPSSETEDSVPNVGVQFTDLNDRMNVAQAFVDIITQEGIGANIGLELKTKTHYSLGSEADQFFQLMTYMLTNERAVEYETDGLIFTPNLGPYNSHSGSLPLEQRVLTDYPDIVKWKPPSKMTIDFTLMDMGTYYELYTYGRNGLELFERYPRLDKGLNNYESGVIAEVGFDDNMKGFIVRIRNDKIVPNGTDVATLTYKDVINPISEDMLQGKGFKMLRHYHNYIKKMMFDYAANKLGTGPKVLMDLGSGRGGDIGKWREFDKIITVEPNPQYIEELKNRLVTYGMQDKVIVIQAKAQDTEIIRNALTTHGISRVSCISSMLSMTFLWESQETLQGFCNTIMSFLDDNGYFIYMVMDGDLVSQLFRPVFITRSEAGVIVGHDYNLSDINFNGAKITWLDNRKIHIHIDESIVTDQEEYLVFLDDLNIRLTGFTEGLRQRADKERLLPFNEKGFSSLFTYGSFQRKKSIEMTTMQADLTAVASRIPILNFATDRAEGDSLPYIVNCDWYSGIMVAITTIGDGSCFFHAMSRLINEEYRTTESLSYKLATVQQLRQALANALNEIDPVTRTKNYFMTVYPEYARVDDFYSLSNITARLANTKEYAGDFVYSLIPTFLGYDLIVLEYREGNLVPHADTLDTVNRPILCIVAYDNHFESLVEYQDDTYVTLFDRNSPFVQAYLRRKTLKASRQR